jgi:exosortase
VAASTTAETSTPISAAFLLKFGWPLWIGLAVLAIPTVITLGREVWNTETGAQGPIVLFTGAWLLWRKADSLKAQAVPGDLRIGVAILVLGLAIYIFGRAYDFISIETVGLYGAILGVAYGYLGARALLSIWFPIFYLGFVVPPPSWLMDSVTAPLKAFVSYAATETLSHLGVPVVRQGVALFVEQYQLLVEDACSGMNSLTGLLAIGLFYVYLLRSASVRYSIFLAVLIAPIAIVVNIIRIMILILLTYFFGDGVAQSFLHVSAGMFLFALALVIVFALDHLIVTFRPRLKGAA